MFRYPLNPSQDFIKRVIGVPGDTVVYKDKKLTVNGEPWPQKADGTYSYLEGLRFETMSQFAEIVAGGQGAKDASDGGRSDDAVGQSGAGARIPRARQLRLQSRWQRIHVQGSRRATTS